MPRLSLDQWETIRAERPAWGLDEASGQPAIVIERSYGGGRAA